MLYIKTPFSLHCSTMIDKVVFNLNKYVDLFLEFVQNSAEESKNNIQDNFLREKRKKSIRL